MRDWAARNADAIKDRDGNSKALTEYAGAVRAQLRTYSTLRGDAQDFLDRVESPDVFVTYEEVYSFFQQAG